MDNNGHDGCDATASRSVKAPTATNSHPTAPNSSHGPRFVHGAAYAASLASVNVREVLRAPAAAPTSPPSARAQEPAEAASFVASAVDKKLIGVFYARIMRSFAALLPVAMAAAASETSTATGSLGLAPLTLSATAPPAPVLLHTPAAAPALPLVSPPAPPTTPVPASASASTSTSTSASSADDDDDDDEEDDSSDPAALIPKPLSAPTPDPDELMPPAFGSDRHMLGTIKRKNIDSARLSCIQRAFDVFMRLDTDHDMTITVDDLLVGLSLFDAGINFSRPDAEKIFRIADTTKSGRLSFAEFYAVYACLTLLQSRFGLKHDMFLTPTQVRSALLEAGLSPSDKQLHHMFRLKEGSKPGAGADGGAHIDFPQILRIYLRSPRSEGELFLQSWYFAGRRDFLHHRQHLEASPVQDFIAGTAAGVALTIVGHPFDTVKVRMQTAARYASAMQCVMDTVRKEGPFALFKGMGSPMATIPLINALVFASYAQGRDFFQSFNAEGEELALWQIAAAGGYAGALNSVVACPVELIKTRLQIQYGNSASGRAFQGPVDCVQHILKASGFKGLFRGMSATIYREIPGYSAQFYCYELLKRSLMSVGNRVESELTAVELLTSGGLAGIAGWVFSYPMDYIKSQIQAEPWNKPTLFKKHPILLDGGFFSAVQQTVARKGAMELWRGFSVCMLRAWPANAAGFLAYESVLSLVRERGAQAKAAAAV